MITWISHLTNSLEGIFLLWEGKRQDFLLFYMVREYYQSFESKIPRSSPEKNISLESGTVFCGRDFMAKTVETECYSK